MTGLPQAPPIPSRQRIKTFQELLQDRDRFVREVVEGTGLQQKLKQLVIISGGAFSVYGLIMGSQHSLPQALSSAVKLPMLFVLTIVICMPALYIFGSFFGSRRSALQTFVMLLAGTSIMAIALVGLAPVTFFFIVTTDSYQFFKLMNVLFFFISGVLGVLFLGRIYAEFPDEADDPLSTRTALLRFWFLLYGFVGTQLAWTLRPFFGSPSLPFEMFREFGGNFYADVLKAIGHVFGS